MIELKAFFITLLLFLFFFIVFLVIKGGADVLRSIKKKILEEDKELPVPPVVPNPVLARQKASLELLIEMVKEIKGLRQDLKLLNAPKNNAESGKNGTPESNKGGK